MIVQTINPENLIEWRELQAVKIFQYGDDTPPSMHWDELRSRWFRETILERKEPEKPPST